MSKPFRKPAYTNPFFTVYFIFALISAFYFILFEGQWVYEILEMFVVPEAFRYKLLMIIFGNFIATYLFENFVTKLLSDYEQRRQARNKKLNMKE